MRLGIVKGAHLLEAPLLCRLLWGTFLAETRKVQLIAKLKFENSSWNVKESFKFGLLTFLALSGILCLALGGAEC